MARSFINSNVIFVHQHATMQEAIRSMVDQAISSILVKDDEDNVVGILTERDIVRKFTLLEMGDKFTRTVSTMMSRPLITVPLANFQREAIKLHQEKRIRHFPIVKGSSLKVQNIVGIISLTDIMRHFMLEMAKGSNPMAAQATARLPIKGQMVTRELHVLACIPGVAATYVKIFGDLGYSVTVIKELGELLSKEDLDQSALVLDLDGYKPQQISDLIKVAAKFPGHLIIATSNASMWPVFKKFLNPKRQEIAIKPIDISYCHWLLTKKWFATGDKNSLHEAS